MISLTRCSDHQRVQVQQGSKSTSCMKGGITPVVFFLPNNENMVNKCKNTVDLFCMCLWQKHEGSTRRKSRFVQSKNAVCPHQIILVRETSTSLTCITPGSRLDSWTLDFASCAQTWVRMRNGFPGAAAFSRVSASHLVRPVCVSISSALVARSSQPDKAAVSWRNRSPLLHKQVNAQIALHFTFV